MKNKQEKIQKKKLLPAVQNKSKNNSPLSKYAKNRNPLLEFVANQKVPEESIHFFPDNAGSKAGLAYVTDDFLRNQMDKAFGKGNWGYELIRETDTAFAEKFGRVAVCMRVWWTMNGSVRHTDSWGEQDIESFLDKNKRLRVSNEPFKSAMTDAIKKAIGDHLGFASEVYDGKVKRKEQEMNELKDSETEITIGKDGQVTEEKL